MNGLKDFLPSDWAFEPNAASPEPPAGSIDVEEEKIVYDEIFPLFDGLCSAGVVGWLTLDEIESAMEHHGLGRSRLDPSVLLVLDAMAAAEARYGKGRVHMVFGIE